MAQMEQVARGDRGMIIGAAAAGLAAGLAANAGRKLVVQAVSGITGDWFDALKTEHRMALAVFDKIEQTRDDQKLKRTTLLAQLRHALEKHTFQEETVIYPALREMGDRDRADKLDHDHSYIKTYLYELDIMAKDDPQWLSRIATFRRLVEQHVREEEDDILPAFHTRMSTDQNSKITALMHKEGFKLA